MKFTYILILFFFLTACGSGNGDNLNFEADTTGNDTAPIQPSSNDFQGRWLIRDTNCPSSYESINIERDTEFGDYFWMYTPDAQQYLAYLYTDQDQLFLNSDELQCTGIIKYTNKGLNEWINNNNVQAEVSDLIFACSYDPANLNKFCFGSYKRN